jgi:hypothetical protein
MYITEFAGERIFFVYVLGRRAMATGRTNRLPGCDGSGTVLYFARGLVGLAFGLGRRILGNNS